MSSEPTQPETGYEDDDFLLTPLEEFTDLELEKQRVSETIPFDIEQKLFEIYEKTSHDSINLSQQQFVDELAWRIYTEACLNPEEKFDPKKYNGEAFKKFINDETLYTIKRSEKRGLIRSKTDRNRTWSEMQEKVLEALVKRGIDCFTRFGADTTWPAGEYLRTDLEPCIGF